MVITATTPDPGDLQPKVVVNSMTLAASPWVREFGAARQEDRRVHLEPQGGFAKAEPRPTAHPVVRPLTSQNRFLRPR